MSEQEEIIDRQLGSIFLILMVAQISYKYLGLDLWWSFAAGMAVHKLIYELIKKATG